MSSDIFTPLQTLTGTTEQKFVTIRGYLFQLAEQLNRALQAVENNTIVLVDSKSKAIVQTSTEASADAARTAAYELKDLITQNKKWVEQEIQSISTTLTDTTKTVSDFGEWKTEATSTIAANGNGITLNTQAITNIQSSTKELLDYQETLNGKIQIGCLGEDLEHKAKYGILISEKIEQGPDITIDGETIPTITSPMFHSVFSANGLEFYSPEGLVAYMSNRQLYITNAVFTGKTYYGPEGNPDWEINYLHGFTIKYVKVT